MTKAEENSEPIWRLHLGDGPLIATAIHDGHALRPEVAELLSLTDDQRLREEDPFTGEWTAVAPTRVVGLVSRFEVDLNRPREKAVYRVPDDAWGLDLWKRAPSEELVQRSLAEYDSFYRAMKKLLKEFEREHGLFVVYDLHTYNHRREGQNGPDAAIEGNPQVNIGTGTMNRTRWAPMIDRFVHELRNFDFPGEKLDVRENVKFKGGAFSRWVHETFPKSAVSIAIEFKKFFMDEWSGRPNQKLLTAVEEALGSTVEGVLEELHRLKR